MIIEDGAKGSMRANNSAWCEEICETISAVFTVNLHILIFVDTIDIIITIFLYYIIIMILISNLLYTHGSCLLDHLGTSMATSPGTSWRVASLA